MAFDAGTLVIRQRELFRKSWTWMREDGVTPFDLTGAEARAECHKWVTGDYLFAFDSNEPTEGTIVLSGAEGRIELRMEEEQTAKLTQSGPFDIFVRLAGEGQRVKFAEGIFVVEFSRTKDD